MRGERGTVIGKKLGLMERDTKENGRTVKRMAKACTLASMLGALMKGDRGTVTRN